jgi:hypothetical protein
MPKVNCDNCGSERHASDVVTVRKSAESELEVYCSLACVIQGFAAELALEIEEMGARLDRLDRSAERTKEVGDV